jgi:hypothetical protein
MLGHSIWVRRLRPSFHQKEDAMRKTGKKKTFIDYELPAKTLEEVRGGCRPTTTTMATGEEGCERITTLALGEEGYIAE